MKLKQFLFSAALLASMNAIGQSDTRDVRGLWYNGEDRYCICIG